MLLILNNWALVSVCFLCLGGREAFSRWPTTARPSRGYGHQRKGHERSSKGKIVSLTLECDNWSWGYKTFSCSTQLSVIFKLLINTEIAQINRNFWFRSPKPVIYPANKC